MAGTDNVNATQQQPRREVLSPAIPDIPAVGDISATKMREILQSMRQVLNQLSGDGPRSALTLEKAVNTGLVARKPPSQGGIGGVGGPASSIDPRSGYGGLTWSGVTVPPPPEVIVGEPSDVSGLRAYAAHAGVYLTWTSPGRSGGAFEIYRAEVNDRDESIRIGTVNGLSYFDGAVNLTFNGDGTASGKTYYYWVRSISINLDGSIGDTFFWSGNETGGVAWELNPNTFAMVVADSILAGRLNVALDFNTDGAIRSGKELVDGVPNSAAGFFINGNFFYFGSDGDGSYIRWNGTVLEIKGNITASDIRGGVIDGATLSGTYLFARDIIYDRDTPLAVPDYGKYQNEYAGVSPDNEALGAYEVRYLVRNEELVADYAMSQVAYLTPRNAGIPGYSVGPVYNYDCVVADAFSAGFPQPYNYPEENFTTRCVNATCTGELVFSYTRETSVFSTGFPFIHYAILTPNAHSRTFFRVLLELEYEALVYTLEDGSSFEYAPAHTESYYFDFSRGAFYTYAPSDDPDYTPGLEISYVDGDNEFGSLLNTDILVAGSSVAVPNSSATAYVDEVPTESGGSYSGTHTIRVQFPLVNHTGKLLSATITSRYLFQTGSGSKTGLIPGGSAWQFLFRVSSDNTL